MNIICNNCVGGRLYQQLDITYANPFIWTRIYYPSFKLLVTEFDEINFDIFEFNDNNGISQIVIENRIELNYTHYIYDKNYNEPVQEKNKLDIKYNNIQKYTIDKYVARLSRMDKKDKPVFILVDNENLKLTDEEINDFLNLKIQYKKICVTYRKHIKSNVVPILYTDETNTTKIAKLLIEKQFIHL